jgi:hypothetical protein
LREASTVFAREQVARRLDDTGGGAVDVMQPVATTRTCRLRGWTYPAANGSDVP